MSAPFYPKKDSYLAIILVLSEYANHFRNFYQKMLNSGNCSVPSAAMAGSAAPTVFFPEAKMRLFYLIRHTIYRRKKIRRQARLPPGNKVWRLLCADENLLMLQRS
ncbi:hypothetical protein HMPREF1548_05917 [Clostridium sp. KLE 1755]|nr:hypothetical protein HMPREF1548_05917 [Clostridium sp. KLE 1755]